MLKTTIMEEEFKLRQAVIDGCLKMNDEGCNHGMSGNISARLDDHILITPTSIPYNELKPEMIVALDIESGSWKGTARPSSEWRFHRDIMAERLDVNAVVHLHPPYATALSMARKSIPACHYMIGTFGGSDVRCAEYAANGSQELSDRAVAALSDRTACLLANHGMIAVGDSLDTALWTAIELEALARHYCLSIAIGGPVLLTDEQVQASPAYRPHRFAAPSSQQRRRKPIKLPEIIHAGGSA